MTWFKKLSVNFFSLIQLKFLKKERELITQTQKKPESESGLKSHADLVSEIEWLIKNYPDQLNAKTNAFKMRLPNIYESADRDAAVIVARCLDLDLTMNSYGFTFEKLKNYWESSTDLQNEERLNDLKSIRWFNNTPVSRMQKTKVLANNH
jgi:hypothetical protein